MDTNIKPAVIIIDATNTFQIVEVTARNAELTAQAGGIVYASVAEAEAALGKSDSENIEFSKVSKLKVRNRPVATSVPARAADESREDRIRRIALELGTVKALRAAGKDLGVKGASRMNKDALVAALTA